MKTININVDDNIADKFERLSKKEKENVSNLLKEIMEDSRSLKEVMEDMGKYAKKQGLTPEMLDDILKDDKE